MDLISRQAAIGRINGTAYAEQIKENMIFILRMLPPAQPTVDAVERKRGKWMHKKITADFHVVGQCSVCKERRRIDNFCPNCGADMRGGEE